MQASSTAGRCFVPISEREAMTGRRLGDFVKVKPNIKSFQHHENCVKKTTDNGAADIGSMICVKMTKLLAPSTRETSQISREMPRK